MKPLLLTSLLAIALPTFAADGSATDLSFDQYVQQHSESIEQLDASGMEPQAYASSRELVICGVYSNPPSGYAITRYTRSYSCDSGWGNDPNAIVATKLHTSSKYTICTDDMPANWVITANDRTSSSCRLSTTGRGDSYNIRYKSGRSMHVCSDSPIPSGYYVADDNVKNWDCKGDHGKLIKRY
ncbi:hypothetical protein A3K86_12545 [Photobacterium jeanii]|uniref:Uncharacterized protein n=1 Tax=Photobacterium jeanii TaxID=858640 RepID=A0A178KAP1_9GAMM|nr:hypothetical protein [Photobacterium jeanii]OAN14035.1 hypothetical protein A3K86_12545 [Photobacterium jeanii]PST86952.1 hypothetical protein C9I91_20270 [Photobacterium jeanii]